MSAWTWTALVRVKEALQADAVLSGYVDRVEIVDKLRDDSAPAFERHGVQLAMDAVTLAPHSPASNDETMSVTARLWIATWTDNQSDLLTSSSVAGGVGASEVGMLQFVEDVSNALRLNSLSDYAEVTGLEVGAFTGMASVPDPERDRVFLIQDLQLYFVRVAAHAPADR